MARSTSGNFPNSRIGVYAKLDVAKNAQGGGLVAERKKYRDPPHVGRFPTR